VVGAVPGGGWLRCLRRFLRGELRARGGRAPSARTGEGSARGEGRITLVRDFFVEKGTRSLYR
jgi:hypothetical protein